MKQTAANFRLVGGKTKRNKLNRGGRRDLRYAYIH